MVCTLADLIYVLFLSRLETEVLIVGEWMPSVDDWLANLPVTNNANRNAFDGKLIPFTIDRYI